METKTISLPSGDLMLIGLPSGAVITEFFSTRFSTMLVYTVGENKAAEKILGKWKRLGFLSALTEEQARGIVESLMFTSVIGRTRWKDYLNRRQSATGEYDCCYDALEALHSLVEANGWYLKNPHGAYGDSFSFGEPSFVRLNKDAQWNEAQGKVNPYLIFKNKD